VVEQQSTALSKPETEDHAIEEELRAEHVLGRAIVVSVLVAVPINVLVWVGLVAFFGTWAAFVGKTHLFEEMDRNVDPGKVNSGAESSDTAGRSPNT
jgi:hypothetical protein